MAESLFKEPKELSIQSLLSGIARLQNESLTDEDARALRDIDFALWDLIERVEDKKG